MKCPRCGAQNDHVVDTRPSEDGTAVRRRRECRSCKFRYTTYERIERSLPLKVVKRRGNIRENFDPDKLRRSIDVVCYKLDVSPETIDKITEEIVDYVERHFEREVSAETLGQLVMEKLKKVNKIAYIRYGSAYEDFENMREFLEDLLLLFEEEKKEEKSEIPSKK